MAVETSVIITNFNNANYIGRAIRSCLNQSLPRDRFEIIIVDDASTDNSKEIIEGFGNKVVSIFCDSNGGVAKASNIGIRNALGRFVIRVDSDDYINEHTLLFLTEILDKNHDIGFVHTDHLRVDKEENILERVNLNTLERVFRHGAGIMFRKSYLEAIGLYNEEFRNAEDHELLNRYIKNFNGFHLPIPLYRYRQHETNITRDIQERREWENRAVPQVSKPERGNMPKE